MRTHQIFTDGVMTSETPYTMSEELVADAQDDFKQLSLDIIGGLPWPVTIDEWRLRYSPLKAVDALITRKGLNPANVPAQTKQLLSFIIDLYLKAIVYAHGKLPGEKMP